ncbi:hypothetical protein SBRCBS47491_007889 [Sporothrix bragantina]|uniref:Beta-lactamase-related domain-containing protein n=1 Tax=Sporothrix bragantina TaxID=671064 RepID=A0ABP0CIA1_9PEZI
MVTGKYRSTDASLPWDQRVDLDIFHDEKEQDSTKQWKLRYNDRKYALAPIAELVLVLDGNKVTTGFSAAFPHWITRGMNGRVVLEKYFDGMTSSTQHIISSCTKSITAVLAGIAIDQGLFGLDDDIASYFPDINTTWSQAPPVLVRHVLSMTAGTEHTVKDAQDLLESTDVEQLVLGWNQATPAGERYNYDNGLPSLIGCLIERTGGIPLVDFANKHLFAPVGITNESWTTMPTPKGRPYVSNSPVLAAGGMSLTLPDFLTIGQMLLHNGVYNGHRVVSEAYLAEATRQQTPNGDYPYGFYFHANQTTKADGTKEWIHLDGIDGYFMLGQGEQVLFISPEEQIIVAAFSSTWHRDRDAKPDRFAVIDCIKAALACI